MGAMANNRFKRNAQFQSSSPSTFDYDLPHVSKKLKSSHPVPNSIASSAVSRLRLYPQHVSPIVREIQAPCVVVRGFTASLKRFNGSSSENSGKRSDLYGNCVVSECKFVDSEMEDDVVEVIDVVNNVVNNGNDASGDSGVEEIAMVESEKEEVNKLVEVQAIRDKYRELDVKAEENRRFQVSNDLLVVSELIDGKPLDSLSLSLNRRLEVDGLPYYKKLLYDSSERDVQLSRLKFDISLVEEKRDFYKQLFLAKKDEAKEDEDMLIEPFRLLADDDLEMVANAFSNSSRRKVLVTHENSNITISGEVLRCLRPGAWLNDEVINLYLELLKEREKKEPKKFLKCHFFNTFFYKKLISGRTGYDYKSVRRWTTQRKLGYSLLECDKIFVPVHKEIHWCLAVINKKEEKFQYLDSLGGVDKQVMRVLARYVVDEFKDKNGEDIDVSSWQQEYVTDLPNQENGFDCGVFMIKYADFYSRGLGLCFKQEHMPYFRLRTAKEILKLRAD
ncbi:putative Ulp1 peptidase [Helianthus annuus]|nr:putative Ulp1 peptidase [Helianthus annuus]